MELILGGTNVRLLRREDLLASVVDRCSSPSPPLIVASANLDHVYHFGRGGPAAGRLRRDRADWLTTLDGVPLVWAARRLTGRPCEQLAGSDLLPEILAGAAAHGHAVGFLGGRPEMHDSLAKVVTAQFPELAVAGYWSPDRASLLDPDLSQELAARVRAAGPTVLVVGLGKPLQELWLDRHVHATGARVALAFGASADFLSGTSKRAPSSWRRLNLEWAYRLLSEPRRLWRRYLLQAPVALWRLARYSGDPS